MTLRARIVAAMIGGIVVILLIVAIGSTLLRKNSPPSRGSPIALLPSDRTPLTSAPSNTIAKPPLSPVNPAATTPSTTTTVPPIGGASSGTPRPPLTLEEQLGSVAFSFAETFGSYSSQAGVENIERLRFLMSRGMSKWADEFIASRKKSSSETPTDPLYYGITTYALSSKLVAGANSETLQFRVQTQRKEIRGIAVNARLILQELALTFIHEDGIWKVDKALWGPQQTLNAPDTSSAGPSQP